MALVIIGIICIVIVVCLYLVATEFNNIAVEKGYNDEKYFWYCFLLPIAGYLMVVALPDRARQNKSIMREVKDNTDCQNEKSLNRKALKSSEYPLAQDSDLEDEEENVPVLKKEVIIAAVMVIVIVFLLAFLYVGF